MWRLARLVFISELSTGDLGDADMLAYKQCRSVTGKELSSVFICQVFIGYSLPDTKCSQSLNVTFIWSKFFRNIGSYYASTQNSICLLIYVHQIGSHGCSKLHILHEDWHTTCSFIGDKGLFSCFLTFTCKYGPSARWRRITDSSMLRFVLVFTYLWWLSLVSAWH